VSSAVALKAGTETAARPAARREIFARVFMSEEFRV
jgi:hypothetical protein